MFSFLRFLGADLRRSPLYVGLLGVGLAAFLILSLRGARLLGDDNESTDAEQQAGPHRAGGHGGYVNGFNHK
jgi:hypothetical protein